MTLAKLFLGTFIGAVITSACFIIALRYDGKALGDSGGNFISFGDIGWQFAVLIGAIYGLPIGGVLGAIIAGSQLNFIKSTILGFFLGLALGFAFFIWSGGPSDDEQLRYVFYVIIIIGTINGAIVSLINSWDKLFK